MEGPESVGVEVVAGARKSLRRKIVVVKELVDGGLKGIVVVVNIVLEVSQEQVDTGDKPQFSSLVHCKYTASKWTVFL